MPLVISNAILHSIGSKEHQVCFSDAELEVDSETCIEFIGKHIRRLLGSHSAKNATFSAQSQVYTLVKSFQRDEIHFKDFSKQVCRRLAGALEGNEDIPASDVLVAFFDNAGQSYIAIIKVNYGECFVRKQTANDNGSADNQIAKSNIVLPLSAKCVEEACLIPYDPMVLRVLEKPHKVGGEDTYYFSKLFLECETQISDKEAADAIGEIVDEVSAKYFEGNIEASAKIKTALITEAEAMDETDGLILENVAQRAFEGNDDAREEFVSLVKEYSLPHQLEIDKSYIQRTFKTQRFKAENGVELKFPAALCQDPEQVQIAANSDGTVTITLKNLYPAE